MRPFRKRKNSLRLKGYDYTKSGVYFITIFVRDRMRVLGKVIDGRMQLSALGALVEDVWLSLPQHYPNVLLDVHCVMPDHFHGILSITQPADVDPAMILKDLGLSEIIRNYPKFQILFFQVHQCASRNSWCSFLASRFLRPRYS
jgi:REP element-mobilizing transposase RayT